MKMALRSSTIALCVFLLAASACDAAPSGFQDYFASFSSKYFSVDLASGTAQTSVPIIVPQGRRGIAPQLALSYNSSGGNGWCGVGWALDMGCIERSIKKGIPKYDDDEDFFQVNFQGASSQLVSTGGNEYGLKVESSFFRIRRESFGWEITDKTGTKYLFGSDTGVQTNSRGTFRWMLDKVVDHHGNTMKIHYQNDAGQTYLSKIEYVGNDVTGEAPTHSVEFVLEEKPDWSVSYATGSRVESRKRLKEIVIKVQGRLARRYLVEYTQSATSGRSLLTRIVQYGSDNASVIPPIEYTYDDTWHGWEARDTWISPDWDFVDGEGRDQGRRLADVNGDGLADMLVGKNGHAGVYRNTGSGWEEDSAWATSECNFVQNGSNHGRRLGDVNGDGLIDILSADGAEKCTCLNTGSGWTMSNDQFNLPDGNFTVNGVDQGRQLADINGDGLADVLVSYNGYKATYLNNGEGWKRDDTWNIPDGDFSVDGYDQGRVLADVNGDGLADLLIAQDNYTACWLNTGDGWILENAWASPSGNFVMQNQSHGRTLVDLNKDGLVDFLVFKDGTQMVFWNNGHGWTRAESEVILPDGANFITANKDQGVRLADIDGDGATDIYISRRSHKWTYLNLGGTQDLLLDISNGIGGKINIQYVPSTRYDNNGEDGLPDLPFPIMTVSKVTTEDGLGNAYTSEYSYEGGKYDYPEREYRGFAQVSVKDADGNLAKNEFHQDDVLKGKLSVQEYYDAPGQIHKRVTNEYEVVLGASNEVRFPCLKTARAYLFDNGNESRYKLTQTNYAYDAYGNVTQVENLGEVGNPSGSHRICTEYAYNTADWIISLPSRSWVEGESGRKVSETFFSYSGANLIEKRQGNSGGDDAIIRYAYDAYGNQIQITDTLGRTSRAEFDPAFHAFPIKTINPLGHVQRATYDPLFGVTTSTTDANGVTTQTLYDAFGRPSAVIGPNATASAPSTVYTYDLSSRPVCATVLVNQSYGASRYTTGISYFDGLGRQIQTLTDADDPGNFIVAEAVSFNNLGQVEKKWIPYEIAGDQYTAVDHSQPHTAYEYDALGRVVQTTLPDGVQLTSVYDLWSTTTIDGNGNQKTSIQDAFGRVVEIIEHAENARTTYGYNARGDLIQVQDAHRNVTTMSYDSLGRKIAMEDPDMGQWSYQYDAAGNLISQTDAKGQTTIFVYDALNRLIEKRYEGTDKKVTYVYDDGKVPNSKGRLTKVTDESGTSEFFFDNEGREIKSVKTVDETSYVVERAYDAVGRVTSVTYPDGEIVRTAYNSAGGVKTVAGSSRYVANIEYTPQGQMSRIDYGNGTSTSYQYNPNSRYLEHLTTTGPQNNASPRPVSLGLTFPDADDDDTKTIQDLTYTFDAAGNIKAIEDRIYSGTQTFGYDGLNRLVGATGAYGKHTYAYDALGNMVSKNGVTFIYGSDRPHALTSTSAGFQAEYDSNGNMISREDGVALNQTLEYDEENRLTRVVNHATKARIRLEPGWNVFSLPLIPTHAGIATILKGLEFGQDYDQISRWSAATQSWEHYVNNPQYNQFSVLEYGRGYQIYVLNPAGVEIEIEGTVPTRSQKVDIQPGWNLIGAPVLKTTSVDEALIGLSRADYTALQKYDPQSDSFDRYENQEFSQIKPGEGYFIYSKSYATIAATDYSLETRFLYDGDGGRVKKIADGVETRYIGKLYEIRKVYGQSGQASKHIFAGSNRIGTVYNTGAKSFYHADHLGSASVITDENGLVVQVVEYTPFGETSKNLRLGGVDVKHKYTGQEIDNETGLYYYNARYYDPQICRFITPDTLVTRSYDPQDLNRYAYARNNPLRYTDPTGHGFFSWLGRLLKSIVGGIAAAVAAVVTAPAGPVVQAMAAGAAYGAVMGAFEGGLKGAAIGAGTGAVGGLAIVVGGPAVAWTAFTATVAYTGATQGAEGLANLGADLVGGGIGFGVGMVAARAVGPAVGNIVQGMGKTLANGFGRMSQKVSVGLTVDVRPKIPSVELGFGARGKIPVGTKITRRWGGESGPFGSSWTRDPASTHTRKILGLETSNTGEFVSTGTIVDNAGTVAIPARKWGRFEGGGDEVLIPDPRRQIRLDSVSMPDEPLPFD